MARPAPPAGGEPEHGEPDEQPRCDRPGRDRAAGGALWGGLIGLIFLVALLGAAIGGATGAAAGAVTDVGVDDKFMKELGQKLQPGNAAVFVLVRRSTPDKVLPRISQYGGDVIHSSLSEHAEGTLQEALREQTSTEPTAAPGVDARTHRAGVRGARAHRAGAGAHAAL
jgi:Protein of unknown function (DUF1269)